MSQQEQWRQIEGYENYMVSDFGRIWSKKRNKIMSLTKNKDGYFLITLNKNGKKFTNVVHKLVAKHFIPNPEGYPEINHKNEDKLDNRVENLEWCTPQYNSEWSKSKAYILYDPNDNKIEINNITKFARNNCLFVSALSDVAKGKQNSYMGYTKEPGTNLNRTGSFSLISPEGKVITFESQQEAANYICDKQQNISKLLNGKAKSCKGYKIKPGIILNRRSEFRLISPQGKVFSFKKQTEAANFIGDSQGNITLLLNGKRKSVKGWTLPDEH